MYTVTNSKFNQLRNKLVPCHGPSDTVEGEIIRAIAELEYRWYNNGDKWFEGYGIETAGNVAGFLISQNRILDVKGLVMEMVSKSDNDYEELITKTKDAAVEFINSLNEDLVKNRDNMFEYEPPYYLCGLPDDVIPHNNPYWFMVDGDDELLFDDDGEPN